MFNGAQSGMLHVRTRTSHTPLLAKHPRLASVGLAFLAPFDTHSTFTHWVTYTGMVCDILKISFEWADYLLPDSLFKFSQRETTDTRLIMYLVECHLLVVNY